MRFALLVFSVFSVAFAKKLPDNFKTCKLGLPNYDDCLEDAIHSALIQLENGLPEIDSPSINPLDIPSAVITKEQHVISFTNLKLYNLSKMKISFINSTHTKDQFSANIELYVKEVYAKCDYSIKGKLMLFSVDGGGKAVITFRDVTVQVHMRGVTVKRNDYMHYRLTNFDFYLKPKSAQYELENIIKGNQELSVAVNKVLNENWDVLLSEFKPELQQILGQYLVLYANNIFKYIPNEYN